MYYLGALKKKRKKKETEKPLVIPPPKPAKRDSLSRYISAPLVFTAIGLTVAFIVYTGLSKSGSGEGGKK